MAIKTLRLSPCAVAVAMLSGSLFSVPVAAQTGEDQIIEEVISIGTRSNKPRTVSDSPVPVDVFSADDLGAIGGSADITDNLNTLIPSYLAAPATGDGSAFVRPTSLRGMASDQTLVLVNGKRRHRSALVQLFAPAANNGSHGVDIAMIPSIALKSVEVLRDGAAAQYGSDAIAGVMNFQLKDAAEGGMLQATYGKHFEGETSWMVGANAGFELGDTGFVNLSINTNDNDALSRGRQRQVAQDLIDLGVQGVGADAVFGDAPFVQTWGRPQTEGTRFVFNSEIELTDTMQAYAFGNYAKTDGRYRFFYRDPTNGDLTDALALGATNLARESVAGFTPFLDGEQTDQSIVIGVKGELDSAMIYDISVSTGSNELDYTLNNSLNGSAPLVGTEAVRVFDTGDYEQEETNFNVDLGMPLNADMFLAFGAEWREETFKQFAGDFFAHTLTGVSGLAGTKPENAGSHSRDNYAAYADIEHDISEEFLLQYALRFEDFSDFGSTLNGKLAFRYNLSDSTALRGAISTGFHAPTPGQANLRSTTTTFDNATPPNQINVRLLPADDPIVALNGGSALTEEEAVNISLGITSDLSDSTTLTVDYYNVDVEGRIYRTAVDDAQVDANDPSILEDISFYTNALDVNHSGIDVVLTHDYVLADTDNSFVLAYGYNKVSVEANRIINGTQVVSDDLVEDIENNYPNHKFTATNNTTIGDAWNLMARVRYIGEHYDERGNIAGTSSNGQSQEIDPVIYVDVELTYDVSDAFSVALGGANIFDEYPDEIENEPGVANRISVGLPYPRRSPANYEGGSWYLKGEYRF